MLYLKVRYLILYILFLVCFQAISQPTFDTTFKNNRTEFPLYFNRNNNFTTILSISKINYAYNSDRQSAGDLKLTGINKNGSVKFNTTVNATGYVSPRILYNKLASCVPTEDKGLLFVMQGMRCSNSSHLDSKFSLIARTDSLGSTKFSEAFYSYTSAGVINSQFYYISDTSKFIKIKPLSGYPYYTFHVSSGVYTSASNKDNHIIYGSPNKLTLIDTSGNVLNSAITTINYSNIKPYKNKYVLLQENKNVLEIRDSSLTIINTYTSPQNTIISDYSICNDSIFTIAYDNINKTNFIITLNNGLTVLTSQPYSNKDHVILKIEKDTDLHLLAQQNTGFTSNNSLQSGGQDQISNTSFSSFDLSNVINYPNDVSIKKISVLQFTTSPKTFSNFNEYYCGYTNAIRVFNNSNDTIRTFHVSHPLKDVTLPSSQSCISDISFSTFEKTYTLTINPFDSIDVELPPIQGTLRSQTSSVTNTFCYYVTLPNNKTDNNLSNSSLCLNSTTVAATNSLSPTPSNSTNLALPVIYPTIVKDELNIHSDSVFASYSIIDLAGKTRMIGGNTKKVYVSALSPAMYFIVIEYSKEKGIKRKVLKFIKE